MGRLTDAQKTPSHADTVRENKKLRETARMLTRKGWRRSEFNSHMWTGPGAEGTHSIYEAYRLETGNTY